MGEQGEEARIAAIADLVFNRGGVAGAVRQIIFGWSGRFSAAQISIALRRRWPLLAPNKHQVTDCLDWLEKRRLIECVLCKHSKLYQRRPLERKHAASRIHEAHGTQGSLGRKAVHAPPAAEGWPRSEGRPDAVYVHQPAPENLQKVCREALPLRGQ